MRVYFLRHGEADWPNWTGLDSDRPLTDKGIKEMKVIGEAIAGLKIELAAILTSPYRRASQTAEAVAHALNLPAKIEPSLEPGFDAAALGALIERQGGGDLMVVGHEPDFSITIRALTGADVEDGARWPRLRRDHRSARDARRTGVADSPEGIQGQGTAHSSAAS